MKTIWCKRLPFLEKDRYAELQKYDALNSSMKLIAGMPLLISVSGHYYEISDLPKLVRFKDRDLVLQFVQAAYRADNNASFELLTFKMREEQR